MGPIGTVVDHLDAARKLLKLAPLRRTQWMLDEKQNDRLDQTLSPTHHVAMQVLLVVVAPPVGDNATHFEEIHELMETRDAACALRHCELMGHLIAGLVAFSTHPRTKPMEKHPSPSTKPTTQPS